MAGHCNSSSSDTVTGDSTLPKNIIMERERRKKFNKKLYDLRSIVPNITKMNKESIIFDAINYIQELQEQERSLLEEISEFESQKKRTAPAREIEDEHLLHAQSKKRRTVWSSSVEPESLMMPSIEVMEVSVRELGNGTSAISITCNKKRNSISRVYEVVESLNLRIIRADIVSSISGRVFHTVVVEVDGMQSACLKEKIKATFVHLDASRSPSIIA